MNNERFRWYIERYQDLINEAASYKELNNMNKITSVTSGINCIRGHFYIVGSISDAGFSTSSNPTVHTTATAAKAECTRLALLNPGKMYVFMQLTGGELVPAASVVSIN